MNLPSVFLWKTLINYLTLRDYTDVSTPFGTARGYAEKSRDGRIFWSFKGIPYAEPPVGPLRFKPPVPYGRFNNKHHDGRLLPPVCTQYDSYFDRIVGQEDCLHLNLYVPKLPESGNDGCKSKENGNGLPVMVWIHGGAFLWGGTEVFGPHYFMDEDVIIVAVQYRLGILGLLNTEDDVISGNMALKDVLEGLWWVNKAIKSFGGDPNKVTVFGQSSGAVMAHVLSLSNQTRGLINNVILQSGTAFSPWAFVKDTRRQAFRVGQVLGCDSPNKNSQQLLNCLQSLDANEFAYFHKSEGEYWSEKFGPSIEYPETEESRRNALLLESPSEISKNGNYHKIPLVVGIVADEGCLLSASIMDRISEVNRNWSIMSGILDIPLDNSIGLEQIRKEYFGGRRYFSESHDLATFTELMTDRDFFAGIRKLVKLYLNLNTSMTSSTSNIAPLYLYHFNYTGTTRRDRRTTELGLGHLIRVKYNNAGTAGSRIPMELRIAAEVTRLKGMEFLGLKIPDYGVCHGDDIKYMFLPAEALKIRRGSENYRFSKDLVSAWVQFAKTSKPVDNWTPVKNQGQDRRSRTINLDQTQIEMSIPMNFFEISRPPKSSFMAIGAIQNEDHIKFWEQFENFEN